MAAIHGTYDIRYRNGDRADMAVISLEHAEEICRDRFGPQVVIHDEWEPSGGNLERRLVWANEDDAENDVGANAVAEIIRVADCRKPTF
jgi:hypothetical protein